MKGTFSILLSFILLGSQMSLKIGTHYCNGESVETKILLLGETHLGCVMPEMDEPQDCEKSDNRDLSFNKVPCCENEYQLLEGPEEFVKNATKLSFNAHFAATFIYTTMNPDQFPDTAHQFYTDYSPPLIEKDIQVFFQTFLI
jgi:hypothetical protein